MIYQVTLDKYCRASYTIVSLENSQHEIVIHFFYSTLYIITVQSNEKHNQNFDATVDLDLEIHSFF